MAGGGGWTYRSWSASWNILNSFSENFHLYH
uniref:Uncharacterized protein n=1 Tax=Rhizophora mucronata TaxID=61149 RepID=A0A2P2K404_RHIMU